MYKTEHLHGNSQAKVCQSLLREREIQWSHWRIISQLNAVIYCIFLLSLTGYKFICRGTNARFPTHTSQETKICYETTSPRHIFPPPLWNSIFCSHEDTNLVMHQADILKVPGLDPLPSVQAERGWPQLPSGNQTVAVTSEVIHKINSYLVALRNPQWGRCLFTSSRKECRKQYQ